MDAVEFHTLTVSEVERLTDDAVAVTLDVPSDLEEAFDFDPGQHVTIRTSIDGDDVRRSYSICADPASGRLRVGIKRLAGGAFSNWANDHIEPGTKLDVMPPVGEFTVHPDSGAQRHIAAVAAGSGITPVISLATSILEGEPASRLTLVFGNQASRSVMFLEELEGLKDRHTDRFNLVHVLSREEGAVPLFFGRIDHVKLDQLLETVVDAASVDAWYLCGPYELVETANEVLAARGVAEEDVFTELFFNEAVTAPPPEPDDTSGLTEVRFTLEGRASTVFVDPNGLPILDHALQVRRELPFSCRGGMCTTCRAQVIDGEVRMDKNWSLTRDELDAGHILTCQSHPTSEELEITYDV